jgi:hypothetical protein
MYQRSGNKVYLLKYNHHIWMPININKHKIHDHEIIVGKFSDRSSKDIDLSYPKKQDG